MAVTATAPIDAQHLADVLRAYLDEYGVRVESAPAPAPGDLRRQLAHARQLGERVRAMAVVRVQNGEGAGGRASDCPPQPPTGSEIDRHSEWEERPNWLGAILDLREPSASRVALALATSGELCCPPMPLSKSQGKSRSPHRLGRIGCALAVLAWLLASAVTARAQPRVPTHVACVGDSITAGVGASNLANNYPSQLQGLLGGGVTVRNFGHSGATLLTTGDTPYQKTLEYTNATSFVAGAGDGAVVDVIIMLGTNDSKPNNWNGGDAGTRAGQFATDLAALVDHFATMSTQPVVYLALPLDALTNTFTISGPVIRDQIIPIINQVATDKALPTIDLNTPTTGQTTYFTVDGVHPNDGGYTVVAGLMGDGLMRVPTVSLTSPDAGAMLPAGDVPLIAEASGGPTVPISFVEFFVGPDSVGGSALPPYTINWHGAQPGTYALTAVATDDTGASATSDPVNVTVKAAGGSSGCGCVVGDDGAAGAAGAWSLFLIGALVFRRRRRL